MIQNGHVRDSLCQPRSYIYVVSGWCPVCVVGNIEKSGVLHSGHGPTTNRLNAHGSLTHTRQGPSPTAHYQW